MTTERARPSTAGSRWWRGGPVLDDDARSVYAALVATEGDVTAAQRRLGADVDLTAALTRLTRLHLLRRGRGSRRQVVDPAVAAAALVSPREADAHGALAETARARSEFATLAASYRSPGSAAGSEILRSRDEANARLHELTQHVRRTAASAHSSLAAPEILEASLVNDAAIVARGIERRDLYLHTTRSHPATMRYLARMLEIGVEVRTTAVIPTRVILFDDDLAVVPVTTGDGVAAVVHDPAVVTFLNDYFSYLWDRALPVDLTDGDAAVPREVELAILGEMATGRSDEAIARRLGMSTRTLRRHLAAMSERLGVDSRFQLGLVAARDGLVSATATATATATTTTTTTTTGAEPAS